MNLETLLDHIATKQSSKPSSKLPIVLLVVGLYPTGEMRHLTDDTAYCSLSIFLLISLCFLFSRSLTAE